MVHSVELLFDPDTDAAVRRLWTDLSAAGIRSQAGHRSPTNRPHVTVTVAPEMSDAVDAALRPLLGLLPLDGLIGAPMLFGGRTLTLVRLLVPSAELLALHAAVDEACRPHTPGGPLPHAAPGQWTPHVTLARRVAPDQLPAAMSVPGIGSDIACRVTALRHWDGDNRVEHPIS
ncbi:2'-5' RNA ligase family protein [Mycolicibacterium sp. S2-37]|uniref:2'-5' RNA ligase family protein n=1 Tax=Mycolicibacterium sp. S2-37 TaxID=2810297 RepID=UPI001A9432C4|nr:2'-5' RNA ligase family protein [Mycolicibacterium sp. S2-37]MBO0676380.1 2'-5' RNA ligase family protein [Mycolicibacterium sp. S2-37]